MSFRTEKRYGKLYHKFYGVASKNRTVKSIISVKTVLYANKTSLFKSPNLYTNADVRTNKGTVYEVFKMR